METKAISREELSNMPDRMPYAKAGDIFITPCEVFQHPVILPNGTEVLQFGLPNSEGKIAWFHSRDLNAAKTIALNDKPAKFVLQEDETLIKTAKNGMKYEVVTLKATKI